MNTLCAACGHCSSHAFNKENVSPLDQRIVQKTTIHIRKSYDSLKPELAKRLFFFLFWFCGWMIHHTPRVAKGNTYFYLAFIHYVTLFGHWKYF